MILAHTTKAIKNRHQRHWSRSIKYSADVSSQWFAMNSFQSVLTMFFMHFVARKKKDFMQLESIY